ncbi:hypothetical protein GB928_000150 [Shinella curvata]|uniref:HEPN AbiU2-like domain-containing protein n=1 Tax=Shinella curvata TaxID=1817964 RepID=A0ABT8X816_9HYPH|nr:hypothetical protein [Shinella curvata]MCJ8052468.1 hypothetical protein [Shinella curvata]MDO6119583.1 hypothetical protein [Shinella curvata]
MRSDIRAALLDEFPELAAKNVILPKEVYAHFGLAFFKFALIEHSLINIIVFSTVGQKFAAGEVRKKSEWEQAFDAAEAKAVACTFGNLVRYAIEIQEFSSLADKLKEAKTLRDYFAHHFMREEAGFFSSEDGCWLLLEKIREVRRKAMSLEEDLKPRFEQMCLRFEIPLPTEGDISKVIERYLKEQEDALSDDNPNVGWEKNAL